MKEKILSRLEDLIFEERQPERTSIIRNYMNDYQEFIETFKEHQLAKECISGYNRMIRHQYWSCANLELLVRPGDICFIDFGQAYINEAGFQHFGLVISVMNLKAFVVPMTSNHKRLSEAMNINEEGKNHLYYIGKIKGLNKPSVLYLNDCRYINTARIITKNAYLDRDSLEFRRIKEELKRCIFSEYM